MVTRSIKSVYGKSSNKRPLTFKRPLKQTPKKKKFNKRLHIISAPSNKRPLPRRALIKKSLSIFDFCTIKGTSLAPIVPGWPLALSQKKCYVISAPSLKNLNFYNRPGRLLEDLPYIFNH